MPLLFTEMINVPHHGPACLLLEQSAQIARRQIFAIGNPFHADLFAEMILDQKHYFLNNIASVFVQSIIQRFVLYSVTLLSQLYGADHRRKERFIYDRFQT